MRAAAIVLLVVLGGHLAFMVSPLHAHVGEGAGAHAAAGRGAAAQHRPDGPRPRAGLGLPLAEPSVATGAPGIASVAVADGAEHCPITPAPAPRGKAGPASEVSVAALWAPPRDAQTPALPVIEPRPPGLPRLHARLGVFLN